MKEEIKLSLFTDDMIVYVENPSEPIFKTPGIRSDYSKVVGYKFNLQNSISFLYTNNEQVEFEIKTQYHLH